MCKCVSQCVRVYVGFYPFFLFLFFFFFFISKGADLFLLAREFGGVHLYMTCRSLRMRRKEEGGGGGGRRRMEEEEEEEGGPPYLVFGLDVELDFLPRQGADSKINNIHVSECLWS